MKSIAEQIMDMEAELTALRVESEWSRKAWPSAEQRSCGLIILPHSGRPVGCNHAGCNVNEARRITDRVREKIAQSVSAHKPSNSTPNPQ